jgi:hypothetical protein
MKTISLFGNPSRNLGNIDFYQFVTDQANRIQGLGNTVLTDADLRQLVVVLLALAGDFNKAILQVQKSLKTEEIMAQDRVRDVSVAALRSGVNNASYSIDPDELRAAAGLTILLDTYGDIAHQALEKESGTIDKLLGELAGPTYKPMIEKLGLSAKVVRLKTDNDAFKALYDSRRDDSLAKDDVRGIDLRRQVTSQYQLLCNYVLLKAKLSNDGQFQESLQLVNAIRKEYLEKVARYKAAKKDDAKPTKSE